jgi:PGF-pre-PGF domain-containing protein
MSSRERAIPFKNSGEITSSIEVLNNRSKLVNSTPEGILYKYVNIWVGKSGFATSANIKDAKVKFKVQSSWIKEMGLSPTDVKLQRYNGAAWEILPTNVESNATDYVVFESQTSGFSPFAITAERQVVASAPAEVATTPIQKEDAVVQETAQPEKTPGFGFSMAILMMGILAAGYAYVKRSQK